MRDLIAISGKQFAGKDAFADFLQAELPEFRKTPLAQAIKQEFSNMYGLTVHAIEEDKATYRTGLITLGQRRRQADQDYWLKKVFAIPGPKIIPDVRLRREADVLTMRQAFLIRLEADRDVRAQRGQLTNESDITECDLDNYDKWDVVVENNGTLDELKTKAQDVAQHIKQAMEAE